VSLLSPNIAIRADGFGLSVVRHLTSRRAECFGDTKRELEPMTEAVLGKDKQCHDFANWDRIP
jgi:hypothetical protein